MSGTFQYRVLWTVQCKKQKLIVKMQSKSSEKLNKLMEVGCVATVDIEKASEVIENMTEDENVHEAKTQSIQVPASVRKS